ncbi:MAG: ABC transporter ATP-binding protein, partial [Acidimicrobiales bacterium]
ERTYLERILTSKDEAKEVRLFALGRHLRGRYDRLYDRRIAALRQVIAERLRRSLVANSAATVAVLVGVVALLQLTLSGHLSAANAAIGAVAVQQLGTQLRGLNGSAASLQESSLFLEDLLTFLNLNPRVPVQHPAPQAIPPAFSHLRLEHVSFRYPGTTVQVLDDVTIDVGTGEIVALVGKNGAGKTTLAKIMCGLYQPTAGEIIWDGAPPGEVAPKLTAIFQDFARFELAARDNIGLGDPDRLDDLDGIRQAAGAAGIDAVLAALPAGYETRLSRSYEGGVDLSIGQWQRVALARALFRDAPFLVLDEPTAALDAQSEYELFAAIRSLQQGRSVLLISHRFSSVRSADRIYVLEHGRVTEQGTHRQLMALGGHYAGLYTIQASAYLDAGNGGAHPAPQG